MIATTDGEFRHPLTRADDELVQDFILTKVTLLLAQNASAHEWHFEIEALRATSTEERQDHNDFLLDYTLARYIAAIQRGTTTPPSSSVVGTTAGRRGSFTHAFTNAVRAESCGSATNIWSTSRGIDAHGIGPHDDLTLALLTVLLNIADAPILSDTAHNIPAPYHSAAPS